MINIGQYIEMAINWMMVHFSTFFDAINAGIGSFIIGFQHVLFGIPFYITILVLAALAWMKAGRGTAIFTALGLLLIYGMGFWEATMQTLALVFSSTCLALIVGVPLGVWTANSPRAEKILRPVLDLMQTMPAFVYLIPAVLFFGLGAVPGVFATIIFAMPPVVRLTGLGIRQVPKNVVEASRSFGATRGGVMGQIVAENLVLTLMAGVVGLLFCLIISYCWGGTLFADSRLMYLNTAPVIEWKMLFKFSTFIYALLFCLALNLLSSGWPAWRASRMSIINALSGKLN